MTIEDFIHGCASITAQAASEVVQSVFNSTHGPLRPVALAALRVSVEASVAAMDPDEQKVYADALEHLQCTVVKKAKEATP